jgi:hypothetical protein
MDKTLIEEGMFELIRLFHLVGEEAMLRAGSTVKVQGTSPDVKCQQPYLILFS